MSLRRFWLRTSQKVRRLMRDEQAQALPMVAVALTMVLGMSAFVIDAAHARFTFRELQATTDSAALAAARAIPTATSATQITGANGTQSIYGSIAANGVAAQYSAVSGGINQRPSLQTVTVTTNLLCLTTIKAQGIPCIGNVPYNAVRVTQTTVMTTYFAGILGHKTMPLTAISTATTRGGATRPSNVAVIVDTTLSMLTIDTNCVANNVAQTQMQCAMNGFQTLLKNLQPCGANNTTCLNGSGVNTNPFDQVALFTFPAVSTSTVAQDTSCTTPVPSSYSWSGPPVNSYIVMPPSNPYSDIPTAQPYPLPTPGASSYSPSGATYQVTGFLNNYRTSNSATTLNTSSLLAAASGAVSSCGSMMPSSYDGVYGTYYAGVIYAAQAALVAQKALYPASDSVIILLSDGDSTAGGQQTEGQSPNAYGTNNGSYPVFASTVTGSGSYPSYYGQCGQAITAAQAATAAGTLVYTVAYGSEPTGCWSDLNSGSHVGVSPCDTMYYIASAPQMFYSDWQQSNSGSTCYSSQPVTALNDIFKAIAADLTQPRLIANNTT